MADECSFVAGQDVVCICDWSYYEKKYGYAVPTMDELLTVRDVTSDGGMVYLRFSEVWNTVNEGGHEPSFAHVGFRPAVAPETDISIFTAMLTDRKRPVLDLAAKRDGEDA